MQWQQINMQKKCDYNDTKANYLTISKLLDVDIQFIFQFT